MNSWFIQRLKSILQGNSSKQVAPTHAHPQQPSTYKKTEPRDNMSYIKEVKRQENSAAMQASKKQQQLS